AKALAQQIERYSDISSAVINQGQALNNQGQALSQIIEASRKQQEEASSVFQKQTDLLTEQAENSRKQQASMSVSARELALIRQAIQSMRQYFDRSGEQQ
ncbi:MAG: hypothetical protein LBU45_05060, partial [Azoarcus sp.]|nr:hypothetical protein [Azoarcus sp.]